MTDPTENGPVLDDKLLAELERVVPGSAERLRQLAIRESVHRLEIAAKLDAHRELHEQARLEYEHRERLFRRILLITAIITVGLAAWMVIT